MGILQDDAANAIEARFKNAEAGALAAWARYTIETLDYPADLDADVVGGQFVHGHNERAPRRVLEKFTVVHKQANGSYQIARNRVST